MLNLSLAWVQFVFFDELVDGVLDSLLGLHDFLNEHFWTVFWVVALSDHSVVHCVVNACHTSRYELLLSLLKL